MGSSEKVIALLLVAAGVPLLLFLWNTLQRTARLQKKGQRVQGEVRFVERSKEDQPSRVHYTFLLPDGTERHHTYQSFVDSWDRLNRGDAIDIVYLPEAPERSMPVLHGVTSHEYVFWIAGGLLVTGLIVFTR